MTRGTDIPAARARTRGALTDSPASWSADPRVLALSCWLFVVTVVPTRRLFSFTFMSPFMSYLYSLHLSARLEKESI